MLKPDYAINNQEGLIEVYCCECENHIHSVPYNRTKSVEVQLLGLTLLCGECLPDDEY